MRTRRKGGEVVSLSEVKPMPIPDTDEIGTLKRLDPTKAYLPRFENPEPLLDRGEYPYAVFDKVYNHPQVYSCMQTRQLALLSKPFEITPAIENDPDAERIAGFVKDALSWIDGWYLSLSELLDAILYGFEVSEIIWTVENGQVWIDRIKGRPHRNFYFDPDLRLKIVPVTEYYGDVVPDRKFVLATYNPRRNNPYGKGLGSIVYWPTWFDACVIKFGLMFAEKYGAPTSVVKYRAGASDEQQKKALEVVDAIQNESGVAIPDWMQIDLLEAQRSGTINVYQYLTGLCEARISKVILGQTLTTDQGDTGSYALGAVHNKVRQDIIEADGLWLDGVINSTIIRWLVDFNFGVDVPAPIYRTLTEPPEDLKGRMDVDEKLVKIVPLPMKDFYARYGWREPEAGEAKTSPGSTGDSPANSGAVGGAGARMLPGVMTGGVAAFSEPARFDRLLELEAATLGMAPAVYETEVGVVKKKSPRPPVGPRFATRSATWRRR